MASDDSSGVRPAPPIVLRIKLRYDDVEVMVQRFATNVGKSGLFLPTKSLQPIGAEIKFELRLADDTPVLVGLGRVKLAQPPDPNNPKATFGMAIELMRVTPQSRALILRMLERRRELGLPEIGLPTPADLDAARRAEAVSGPVRDAVSEPVPVPAPGPPSTSSEAPRRPAPSEAKPPAPAPGEVLLTSPRRPTGPMAVAKVVAVTPLAPEAPRRKRMAVSELIESASGPVGSVAVAVPGLDDEVDLAAAIVRARALAGGALDAELAALSEVAATPVEISIDAASAELARQFGGSAVLRDRNARWAPPPAIPASPVTSPAEVEDEARHPKPRPEPAQVPEPGHGQVPERAHGQVSAPGPEHGHEPAPDPASEAAPDPVLGQAPDRRPDVPLAGPDVSAMPPAGAAPAGHDGEARDARSFAPPNVDQIATDPNRRRSRPRMSRSSPGRNARDHRLPAHREVEPDQIADEIHQLSELDLEDVEHTEMGEVPIGPGAFALRGDAGEPSAEDQVRLAARLEAQLAEAEAEAEVDDLGIGGAAGMPASRESATAFGAPPGAEAEPREDQADEPLELEDFEILAEADADDADLLLAHGEQEASRRLVIHEQPPVAPRGASELDFAARLDLDEESDMYFAVSGKEFAVATGRDAVQEEFSDRHAHDGLHGVFEGDSRLPDPPRGSAGRARAVFAAGDESLEQTGDLPLGDPGDPHGLAPTRGVQPIFDSEGSNSYTLASMPDSDDLDFPPLGRRQPAGKQPAAKHPEPAMLRGSPPEPQQLHDARVEDHELENALGALDVSLDDLSIPRAAPEPLPHREPAKSRPNVVRRQVPPASPSPAQARGPGAPARAVQKTGSGRVVPGSGRVAVPRATTDDGVVIEFDEDDDR
jgi:hypothetical protein